MNLHYSADDSERDEAKARETEEIASPLGYVYKGGKSHRVIAVGGGRVMRKCRNRSCLACGDSKSPWDRFDLLPCNHHALLRVCTCKYRDRQCGDCEQVFIAVGANWYRIADPHEAP